ncbi:class I SAM-dependent methyltransferase [Aurantiacibacter spongiae]|uniref:Methyltransferase n=1 Tax=Aurantiacibacter spongiae TaxID=2488860 RepID=A0A3N5CUV8_9SPHN|nr:class I SAM-dependent methyltransferase [Aurantiacibacter spongiae]RPF71240.1 methyltransferase [Aurantiacibacter spongiae]
MRKSIAIPGVLLMACALAACADTEPPAASETVAYSPARYQQAITDIARTDDRRYDDARKPGELLAFAQIDRGDVVGDFIMGGGYVTRLLAMAVGADGKVYAFQPDEFIARRPEYAQEQDAAIRPYTNQQGEPVRVFPLTGPIDAPGWPEPLDTVITALNFHDLYLDDMPEGTPERVARMLFDALKPGGTLVVVDHLAADGSGPAAANDLHRMDRQVALDLLTGAGFTLEEESDLYSRPSDDRRASVFDDSVRGSTDQFAWRLRKPD